MGHAAAGIIFVGSPADTLLRRACNGVSTGAILAQHAYIPVLFMPAGELVQPAMPCPVPATMGALQAAQLMRRSGSWQRHSAAAA